MLFLTFIQAFYTNDDLFVIGNCVFDGFLYVIFIHQCRIQTKFGDIDFQQE